RVRSGRGTRGRADPLSAQAGPARAAERRRVVPAARRASSHVLGRLQAGTFVTAGRDSRRSVCREGPAPVSFSPVATTERDFYVILGVERIATDAEIKRAFRKLAQQWH